jgi:D-threo-aldose 1-dehydrogenase
MTALPRRPLGLAPLAVSVLGFGAAPLGGLYQAVSAADAGAAVEAALTAGVTYFDTAPLYGHGLSEHRLGEALREVRRDDFVLSTKVGRLLRPARGAVRSDGLFENALPFDYVYDYSGDGARRSLEDSLQRLGLARVDIALIHDVVPRWHGAEFERRFRESMEGAYPVLAELRAAGVVRAIGVGVKDWDVCLRYLRAGDFDCVMLAGQYTLLCQDALPELLPHCARTGVGVLLAAPFNSGILATGAGPDARYFYQPAPPEILARTRRLEAVCRRHDVTLGSAALQFSLAHPAVSSVVPGARSRAEVDANVRLVRQPIPPDFWQELKGEGLLPVAAPVP